jgi:hypothetical protein
MNAIANIIGGDHSMTQRIFTWTMNKIFIRAPIIMRKMAMATKLELVILSYYFCISERKMSISNKLTLIPSLRSRGAEVNIPKFYTHYCRLRRVSLHVGRSPLDSR